MAADLPDAPLDSPQGAAGIFAQARAGEAGAMHLAAILCATGVQCDLDWPAALDWLAGSAARGGGAAKDELVVLTHDEDLLGELAAQNARGQAFAPDTWARLARGVDLDRLLKPPAGAEIVVQDPVLGALKGMASPRTCAWIIARATPLLDPARVYHDGVEGQAQAPIRTNKVASFELGEAGLPMLALRARIAVLLGGGIRQLEPLQVLRYEPGQAFDDHYDAFGEDEVSQTAMGPAGQRIRTLLVSLNADYEGGETEFPVLSARYRGLIGQAIFWSNADAAGRRDRRTLHAGRPPTTGIKWMVSQWMRERDYVG